MNITLLGHHDIASLYALDRVIASLPEHRYSVVLSGEPNPQPAPGSPLSGLEAADAELCRRFLRGNIVGRVSAPLAEPTHPRFNDPNSTHGLKLLSELRPDLFVSIRYRRILRDEAIAIPERGVLNLHSGILPDYRGVMATFWAMLAGEAEIGTTLHRIVDSGIDTGPVIGISRRATRPECSYLANVLGLYADGCDMIADAVRAIAADRPLPVENQVAKGPYFKAPGAGEIRRFERKQLSLFTGEEMAEICPRP